MTEPLPEWSLHDQIQPQCVTRQASIKAIIVFTTNVIVQLCFFCKM